MVRKNLFEMEKIIVKKLIGLSISLLVLFVLAACSGQTTPQNENDQAEPLLKNLCEKAPKNQLYLAYL